MYKQSIKNIKLVILPLDGTILDLNRLRFNYYKHLCSDKNITITREVFSQALSNMYDMYNELPLHHIVDSGPLNAKIERELLQYSKYKGIQPKEGFYEFLEYLKQKDIQIAVMSTHRTKDAVEYLKLINVYHQVHFIIGSDTSSFPLPSTQILETIMNHFHVSNEETLVVSSFHSLNQVASSLHLNLIYCEDLVKADSHAIESSYKVASSLFEVLNILLFDQYENTDIYSPILGMDKEMSKGQLNNAYEAAKSTYQDDEQIMNLVDKTYQYHVSQLQEDSSLKVITRESSGKHFSFDDEEIKQDLIIKQENMEQEEVIQEEKEEVHEETFIQEETNDTMSHQKSHIHAMSVSEENEFTALLDQINKKKEVTFLVSEESLEDTSQEEENETEEIVEKEKEQHLFVYILTSLLYILAASFLILFIGILFSVAFIHPLRSGEGIFGMIASLFYSYNGMVEFLFSHFFNGIHAVISFVPDYATYNQSLSQFSIDGVQLLNLYIFHCFILGIVNIIWAIIKGERTQIDD